MGETAVFEGVEAQRPVSRRQQPVAAGATRRLDSWWLLSLPLLLFITLPLIALLIRAPLDQLWRNLQQPAVYQALRLSFSTSFTATLITVLLGTPLAFVMARRTFPLQRVLDTLIDLPAVMPPAVAGVALLMAFGRRGIAGPMLSALGVDIAFTWVAVVLAQLFIAAPFYIKSAVNGFGSIEPELEQSAALDGANEWQVFRHVTAPLSRNALLTGAVLTWARALGEFGATIIFAGNFPGRTQTMPLAIYIGFEIELNVALTLSVILLSLSFLMLVLVKTVFRHG